MNRFHAERTPGLLPFVACALLAQPLVLAQETGDTGEEELNEIVLPGAIGGDENADIEDNDAAANRLPVGISPRDRLQDLFRLYRDAMNDHMYGEADTLAKQIVELTIEVNGLDSSDTARAITNLAIAQHGAADYESAELNFQSAIDIIESISDRLNEALINPLKGLAASQLALGKAGLAADSYLRANHISQVNFGPHNLEQIEGLESLAETYLVAGELDEAIDLQERIFSLQSRNIDPNSEELIPALLAQARWLHRLRQFDKERYAWRRMISILQDSRGKNDLSLIAPLTGLGKSYLFVSLEEATYNLAPSITTGEVYLKRAMRIAENNPAADWTHEAQTKIALGDFYILSNRAPRAERMYRRVWEIYSEDESRAPQRLEELQSLAVIQRIAPPRVYGADPGPMPMRRPDGYETGSLTFNYTVTARGSPTNIELLEAEPSGLDEMERRVARELRGIVHRPRVVDGQLRSTDDVRLTHSFYYRPSDLPSTGEADSTNEDATAGR